MNYDNYVVFETLKGTNPDRLNIVKSIFISVGENEKGDDLKSFADLRDLILTLNLPDSKFRSIIIEDEGHLSAVTSSLAKGLTFLYGEK